MECVEAAAPAGTELCAIIPEGNAHVHKIYKRVAHVLCIYCMYVLSSGVLLAPSPPVLASGGVHECRPPRHTLVGGSRGTRARVMAFRLGPTRSPTSAMPNSTHQRVVESLLLDSFLFPGIHLSSL